MNYDKGCRSNINTTRRRRERERESTWSMSIAPEKNFPGLDILDRKLKRIKFNCTTIIRNKF